MGCCALFQIYRVLLKWGGGIAGRVNTVGCHKDTKARRGIAAQWNTGNTLRPELNERKRDLPAANGNTGFATETLKKYRFSRNGAGAQRGLLGNGIQGIHFAQS